MKCIRTILALGIFISFTASVWADVPKLINFQGRLSKDTLGTPVKDSTYSVLFTIYDSLAEGTNLWSETQSVATKGGTFNVNLGSSTVLPDNIFEDTTRYLAMKVGTDPEMTPRQRMVSMAYGYRVRTVDGASGGTIFGNTSIQSDLSVSGNIELPVTSATTGIIKAGGDRFLHNFGLGNTFVGINAGNLSMTGALNTAQGSTALKFNTSGSHNSASGQSALFSNTTGSQNTACGQGALANNTTGSNNTASGYLANSNTTGNDNTAYGYKSLYYNVAGSNATAVGTGAMFYANNTSTPFINSNVAVGYEALRGSTNPVSNTGICNTALGYQTLLSNTTGIYNTASGCQTLLNNTTGSSNTASGLQALYSNTTGSNNTASGLQALYSNTTGNDNTASGFPALYSNTTGNGNTALGYNADVSSGNLTNATAIGYGAVVDASDKVRIGNAAVTSIGGQVGWSVFSDIKMKTNVKESPLGLNLILELRPITYNSLFQGQEGITYTGLIAQEVEKVLQKLGADFSGLDKPKNKDGYYQLRYAEFVMPLIKAVQEQQKTIQSLEEKLEKLEKKFSRFTSQTSGSEEIGYREEE